MVVRKDIGDRDIKSFATTIASGFQRVNTVSSQTVLNRGSGSGLLTEATGILYIRTGTAPVAGVTIQLTITADGGSADTTIEKYYPIDSNLASQKLLLPIHIPVWRRYSNGCVAAIAVLGYTGGSAELIGVWAEGNLHESRES
jgi:hypothetical protein